MGLNEPMPMPHPNLRRYDLTPAVSRDGYDPGDEDDGAWKAWLANVGSGVQRIRIVIGQSAHDGPTEYLLG